MSNTDQQFGSTQKIDEIEYAVNTMVSKGRTMQNGVIIIGGRKWKYKIEYLKPKNKTEWLEAFKDRKKGWFGYLPNHSKHKPINPLGKCDLCDAPIYEETEPEHEGYCWNCGVRFE